MKKFMAVLLVMVVLFTAVMPKQTASAEALTLGMISAGILAVGTASGINFGFTGYSGTGVQSYIENLVNSWLAGRTIAEAFGSEVFRLVAGKLIIGSAAIAGIVDFLGDLKDSLGLQENSGNETIITAGQYDGKAVAYLRNNYNNITQSASLGVPLNGFGGTEPTVTISYDDQTNKYRCDYVKDGRSKGNHTFSEGNVPQGWFYYTYTGASYFYAGVEAKSISNGNYFYWNIYSINVNSMVTGQVTANIPGTYAPPEGLNDLQSWEGTVSDAPDTNIGDLLDDIFGKAASGDLVVGGDIVDNPPVNPEVTPVPTAEPGDIIGLDTISGQLEGIDQTLTGVQEGVGEAVGELEGINEGIGSISEALEVPTTSEASAFKFDLTTLFPFCIPFDIYRFVTMFSASPVAPHVQIPFNIPAVGLQYTFDLDFSSFNSVASVLRSVELIAFCVGLAILTSKVIRW